MDERNRPDDPAIQVHLSHAKSTCRIMGLVLFGITMLFAVFWAATTLTTLLGGLNATPYTLMGACYAFVYGGLGVLLLWKLVQVLKEVADDGAPFSVEQADRLKTVAGIALALVVLELAFTVGFNYEIAPEVGYGFVANGGVDAPTINLNIGMLVFSAIMYSLSAIFRYAALLQQLSDETV